MYQRFGATVHDGTVTFKVFIPDNRRDPRQYRGVADPYIDEIRVVGSFQGAAGGLDWDPASAPVLRRSDHPSGHLWTAEVAGLPDGWYQYKYYVTFAGGERRWVTDPCARYVGGDQANAGFVVGGNEVRVRPLERPHRLCDEVQYELNILDFTAGYRGARAPVDAVVDRLDHLAGLGVTSIQFMPWTVWPGQGFSWGYNVAMFFAAEQALVADDTYPLDRNFRLAQLVNACHDRNISVYMDAVLNHVDDDGKEPALGFPYRWLYRNPEDSPYTGIFEGASFFKDLQFDNLCAQQFITDVCLYWLDTYQIDGIRFDYARGFLRTDDVTVGLGRLVPDLRDHLDDTGRPEVALVLEHLTDNRYEAIDQVNRIGADGMWFDPFDWATTDAARAGRTAGTMIRALDTARGFEPGRFPVIYLSNHDHSSITDKLGGRAQWWRTQPGAVALFTCAGGVLLRNGQEFGQDDHLPEHGDGRVLPRPLDWSLSTDAIGLRLRDLYTRLARIRHEHPVLRHGGFRPAGYDWTWDHFDPDGYGVDADAGIAVYARHDTDETVVVVLNFSSVNRDVKVPFAHRGVWRELLDGADLDAAADTEIVSVPSHWARVFAHPGGL